MSAELQLCRSNYAIISSERVALEVELRAHQEQVQLVYVCVCVCVCV